MVKRLLTLVYILSCTSLMGFTEQEVEQAFKAVEDPYFKAKCGKRIREQLVGKDVSPFLLVAMLIDECKELARQMEDGATTEEKVTLRPAQQLCLNNCLENSLRSMVESLMGSEMPEHIRDFVSQQAK